LKRLGTIESEVLADTAYRSVLPDLVGYENIRDFIACVTHGMQITAITAFQASKLLYGAQVALAALRIQPRPNECPNESQVPSPLPLPGYESESKT
jgi:hypothetical protein